MSDAPTYRQTQDAAYFENERADVVAKLPGPLGRVLDVGCGAGGVGRSLRARGATEVVGIEVNPEAGERARAVLDEVHVGTVEDVVARGDLSGEFDTIVLYDVLEHLVDPGAVIEALVGRVRSGGHVHVSVPNARHWTLLRDLVARGTFGYTETGHRDSTHLRWFTRSDMESLLASRGLTVVESSPSLPGRNADLDRVTLGRLRGFLALQWHVLAQR